MNEDTIKGNWKIAKGKLKQAYGELSDDELSKAEGNYEEVVGLIQRKYGETREQAEKRLRDLD